MSTEDRKPCSFKLPADTRASLEALGKEYGISKTEVIVQSVSGPNQVYVMKNLRNGLFKIGTSKMPLVREKTLQSEEPEVILVSATPAARWVERALHVIFAKQRVRGEWFALAEEEALRISDMILTGLDELMNSFYVGEIKGKNPNNRIARTYRIPAETDATIKRLAKERDVSEADVIAQAVEQASWAKPFADTPPVRPDTQEGLEQARVDRAVFGTSIVKLSAPKKPVAKNVEAKPNVIQGRPHTVEPDRVTAKTVGSLSIRLSDAPLAKARENAQNFLKKTK